MRTVIAIGLTTRTAMATWSTHIRWSGSPEQVLRLLTEPEAITRWSPVGFELRAFVHAVGQQALNASLARIARELEPAVA
jgi:hypothetical protein